MSGVLNSILVIIFLTLGVILGYLLRKNVARRQAESVERKIKDLVSSAKDQAQKIVITAKEKAALILEDIKKEDKERQNQIKKLEQRLERREGELDKFSFDLGKEKKDLEVRFSETQALKRELEALKAKQVEELSRIATLSESAAKDLLFRQVEESYKNDILLRIKKLEQQGKEELEKKAKELITTAVQRYASSQVQEITTTVVSLPSDDLKGRIIGKEGRNIRTIENLTGVEIIVDDTPGSILISGFDPVRRQVAKLALEKLINDGRIQPAKIEEAVEWSKEEIVKKIKEAGEAACYECSIVGLDPKLVTLLGRLAFRTSFGQNVLQHSIEMAHVAGILATELGADVSIAKKAALLHDIGKAVDHEVVGTHVDIGRKILQKFNVDEKVIKGMQSHHEEYPFESAESLIVQAADAISASRPGARRDTIDIYLKRLEDLEKISNSFEGIEKSYAIQAGREVRIFVTPTKIDDLGAAKLARDIANRIEEEMKYPGEIKVNVIRETRAVEYAR